MDENENENGSIPAEPRQSVNPLWVAVVVLLCLAAVVVGFIVQQHKMAGQLSARNQDLTASLTQTKGQLQTLATELNTLQTEQAERGRVEKAARRPAPARYHHAIAKKVVNKDDPRWQRMQAELAENQKAIASTQQDIEKTRSDLQGNLSSTRDELNGSIAKTHDELVELEKKGERSYYEFDLFKEKRFQRVGPIEVSLRKTNAKHQFCNLQLLVNDREVTKKHINVYEPVLFYTQENGQPVQLVINEISKNHMHGYVSAPKYQGNQAAANTGAAAGTDSGASANATTATAMQPTVVDLRHRTAAMK